MTTTPKAKKFRIRRPNAQPSDATRTPRPDHATADPAATGPAPAQALPRGMPPPPKGGDEQLFAPAKDDDGFGGGLYPTAAATLTPAASVDEAIGAIRKEGLTGRQLRMARRVAQKHGLAPTSDFDAVRLLREQGVDPFQRPSSLELVVPEKQGGPQTGNVPQTVQKTQLPSTEVVTEDTRAKEIISMQRDIARRRRRKMAQLITRLGAFVLLPTFIAGWYYFVIATPMYSTKSEFVIQQAQPSTGGASGLAGMFSGTSLATSQDSIAVQGYLGSLEALLRLETDVGFISHFSSPNIDPLQRLEENATKEQAYKVYRKNVKISYDPTEGIIKLEVIAADPQVSADFANHLIAYAEEQVDNLTQRLREDQMAGARASFADAEENVLDAQRKVLALQENLGVLDPLTESQALMTQVTTFETQLQEKKLTLAQLQSNARPNRARVEGTQGDIARLEALIAELRSQMTQNSSSSASLASMTGQLRLAEADLQTRQLMLTQALQQLETARIEANRQTRYLENSVKPIAPDTASYPRAFENTLLAMLIFGGIYLMISLTASILREQVSS